MIKELYREYVKGMFKNHTKLFVAFVKKNGEERIMSCSRNLDVIPKSHHPVGTSSKLSDDVCRVFDLEKQEWRSFRYDSVKLVTPLRVIEKKANTIARNSGCGKATKIVFGDHNAILEHIRYGYRKYTTGEYVSNKYRQNFGWKNTYYQPAKTTVMLHKFF